MEITKESINYLEELANYITTGKYARYNIKEQRRELWSEMIDRVKNMHLEKYAYLPKEDLDKIKWAFSKVKDKLVVPSMRSLQFGGGAVFAHNARIYNCSTHHVNSLRSFSESFYLLLCGVGLTFGITKKYLSRLPNLVNENDKSGIVLNYVVEDTIEGWADSVEALLMSFFKNTPYSGRKVVFDYSKIRKKGEALKTGGGKAPGHKGLKQAHLKIKNLLNHVIEVKKLSEIRTIDVYDILMYCADAVLSGGIRRSACAIIFDKADDLMLKSKTEFRVDRRNGFIFDKGKNKHVGSLVLDQITYEVELSKYEYQRLRKDKVVSWLRVYPQRARSNNSVIYLREELTKKELTKVIDNTKMWGEPAFVFSDNLDTLYNPCVTGGTIIHTDKGDMSVKEALDTYNDLLSPLYLLSYNEGSKSLEYKQFLFGEMTKEKTDVLKIETEEGEIVLTPDHKVYVDNKGWVEAKDLSENDILISYS